MAQAFVITPDDQSITPVELNDHSDIAALIGFDTVASDDISGGADRLFFDEECFIRGATGRFQIDKLIPVAGKGVVVGVSSDGSTLIDVALDRAELLSRTRFE
jgi:hypothetical protein